MRRVALQRVAGRLLDVQPHTKIDRGVYWNVCADFLWGWRGVRGYAVADECNGRNWTTGDCAGPRTGDCDHGFVDGAYLGRAFQSGGDVWILGDQEAFDDGHVVLLAGTTGGGGGGGRFCARRGFGGSVAEGCRGGGRSAGGCSQLAAGGAWRGDVI